MTNLLNKEYIYNETNLRMNKWLTFNYVSPIMKPYYYLLESFNIQLNNKIKKYLKCKKAKNFIKCK